MDSKNSEHQSKRRRTNILSPPTRRVLVNWLRQEGESIHRYDPLCVMGWDGVHHELVSPVDGTLLKIRSAAGSSLLFNTVIAVVEVTFEALDIEDEMLQVLGYKVPPDLTWVESAIQKLEREKNEAISVLKLELAAELADKMCLFTRQYLRWRETRDEQG